MSQKVFSRITLLVLAILSACLLSCSRKASEDLPKLGHVPNFTLTDQDGKPFSTEQLRGKIWIASFMFTSCPTVCPVLMQNVSILQKQLRKQQRKLHFVSISVDPDTDTPKRLRLYAQERGYSLANWSFLTGESANIRQIVANGFRVAMGSKAALQTNPARYDILHGTHLVMVDTRGDIRGYYSNDAEGLRTLEAHALALLSL